MRRWSEVADRVGATSKTSEKTAILAEYLEALPLDALPIAAVFLTARPFPEVDGRSTGLGWSGLTGVVLRIAGADPDALRRAYDRFSDVSAAVVAVLEEAGHAPDPLDEPTVPEVRAAFEAGVAAQGTAAKAAVFEALFERSSPRTVGGIVKVLTGELRIGLREGLLEAAIARAFGRPLEAVKRAGMLTGDLGRTAVLAREDRLGTAQMTLFHPLKFMLASPAEDAAAIIGRLGPTVWVEDKYDGIRAQLHRSSDEVRLYSRDLNDISGQFPEVIDGARNLPWAGILDGELLAWKGGVVLPFLQLQARLGRKDPSEAIRAEVPVIYVAWDVLGLDREGDRVVIPMLEEPLTARRRILEDLWLPPADEGGRFALSHLVTVDSVDGLEAAFADARARRNEGLLVKDPGSRYSPGRRGLGWLKMKKALATLDCVVVGVEVGHGKRHGVLSDYTFAVRNEETGTLVTIGKAYSGLTDAEIAEMTAWFEAHTISTHGRYRVVEPSIVIEVAFDVIMRSTRHRSGYALRFPRIKNLRRDKPATEVDTLVTVARLYEGLQQGPEHLVTAGARR
ncbi:MAG TPA: ATP-dependent DNA ligase [Candidatus Limnocylindrales bacterium]|nr:ATP-dependent DNA ligase [Candidatus Limnocylindrales bacterium]